MTIFVQLLNEKEKKSSLLEAVGSLRRGEVDPRVFAVNPRSFRDIPGAPFSYWVSGEVRSCFLNYPALEGAGRTAQHGGSTKDDGRFLRTWWETEYSSEPRWSSFAKGGAFSLFYADVYLVVNWRDNARELEAALLHKYPYLGETANWVLHRECNYGSPGLTWPSRTLSGLGMRVLPTGCIFSSKGPAVFVNEGTPDQLLSLLAVTVSTPFRYLVALQMASVSFEVGVIQRTPVPEIGAADERVLADLAHKAWVLKRKLDTIEETSHAFLLPAALRPRLGEFHPPSIEAELIHLRSEIDNIVFARYGFSNSDRAATAQLRTSDAAPQTETPDEDDVDDIELPANGQSALLSWAIGVVFGRFDWRLATGLAKAQPEPRPFDPLPKKSPGMLSEGELPYRAHGGIFVDDQGHPHDLARAIEDVLTLVEMPGLNDVRLWLRQDFFAFHLQRYSKSRRKAPIYWPLSTVSGSFTLWVYYPALNSQTLFTAINDFVEPRLQQIDADVTSLRNKGSARTREDEKQFESFQAFELELTQLRDILLQIAPTYKPNHDDGVQISAAPLWPLFRHKPWQKTLQETWNKLGKGDYDWAHLAMTYWPERVREKCTTDKSLAIAHGLEVLYIEPQKKTKKVRGKKSNGADA